jgi:hypothetical protein
MSSIVCLYSAHVSSPDILQGLWLVSTDSGFTHNDSCMLQLLPCAVTAVHPAEMSVG